MIESPHPYSKQYTQEWTIEPSCQFITVNVTCKLEGNEDSLTVGEKSFVSDHHTPQVITELLFLESPVTVRFVSDRYATDWGFLINWACDNSTDYFDFSISESDESKETFSHLPNECPEGVVVTNTTRFNDIYWFNGVTTSDGVTRPSYTSQSDTIKNEIRWQEGAWTLSAKVNSSLNISSLVSNGTELCPPQSGWDYILNETRFASQMTVQTYQL